MRIRNPIALLALLLVLAGESRAQRENLSRALANAPRLTRFPAPDRQTKGVFDSGNPKISPELRLLVEQAAGKGLDASAKGLGIPTEGSLISVELVAEGDADALRNRVRAAGGRVSATYRNIVFADIPAAAIESLGARRDVSQVRPQSMYRSLGQGTGTGAAAEGVIASKVVELHRRGITGKGVKIGILDFGFARYPEMLQAGRAVKPVGERSFRTGQEIYGGTEIHGTACAEVIHAMAPDAEIYLALSAAHTGGMIEAAQWLASQGVQIISASVGGHMDAANGAGLLDQFVDDMTQKTGILWVVAAGNEGDVHWMGETVDRDGDGLIDIAGSSHAQFLAIQAGGTDLDIQIVWDAWGANPLEPSTTEDIDACIFQVVGEKLESKACSAIPQKGAGSAPHERILATGLQAGGIYLLAMKATHITRASKIHVTVGGAAKIEPAVKEGSVGSPASSHSAVAVGAVDVTKDVLEAYSSHGPTDDGRLKPEVSAPDNTETPLYKAGRFRGTSAATPHTAGFVALLKQADPRASRARLVQAVEQAVRPKGEPVPNTSFGYGHIDGSRVAQGVNVEPGPGSGGGPVTLPAAFGGSAPAALLDRLRDTRPAAFDVRVVTGRPTYQVGDGIRIGLRTAEDCYFVLLHRDANGSYTMVSPRVGEEPRLRAGQRYALPHDGEAIRVSLPLGREQFILICSKSEISLGRTLPGDLAVSTVTYEVTE